MASLRGVVVLFFRNRPDGSDPRQILGPLRMPTKNGRSSPHSPPFNQPRRLLRPSDVARMLAVSRDTLARWRAEGRGPSFIKLGKGRKSTVRYTQDSVREFLACSATHASGTRGAS